MGNKQNHLEKIKTKLKLLQRLVKWRFIDWPQYLKYSALKKPDTSDYNEKDLKMLSEYYENGVILLDRIDLKTDNNDFLNTVHELFEPMIEKFNETPLKDEEYDYVDEKGRFWIFNNVQGGLSVSFANEDHPSYRKEIHTRYSDIKPYSFQNALEDYPFLKQITQNPNVLKFSDYANFGGGNLSYPFAIKLERRTHADFNKFAGHVDVWPHIPHLDHHKSASKCFLYLNDTEEENGPIAFSQGSHHWKLYPQLAELFLARQKNTFSNQLIKKIGVNQIQPYCAQAGTLFGFTTNAIHRAVSVAKGRERWSVHVQYYTERDWASDKVYHNDQLLGKTWERLGAIFAFPAREIQGSLETLLK